MCIQWTRVLYSVVITRQSNPPISQFNSWVSGQCLYTVPVSKENKEEVDSSHLVVGYIYRIPLQWALCVITFKNDLVNQWRSTAVTRYLLYAGSFRLCSFCIVNPWKNDKLNIRLGTFRKTFNAPWSILSSLNMIKHIHLIYNSLIE